MCQCQNKQKVWTDTFWCCKAKVFHTFRWHQQWTDWQPVPVHQVGPAGTARNTVEVGPHWALNKGAQRTAVSVWWLPVYHRVLIFINTTKTKNLNKIEASTCINSINALLLKQTTHIKAHKVNMPEHVSFLCIKCYTEHPDISSRLISFFNHLQGTNKVFWIWMNLNSLVSNEHIYILVPFLPM